MHLEQALLLGQPENHVRVFADLGLRMHDLLARFHSRHVSPKYVRRIASAVTRDTMTEGFSSQAGLLEPLTDRELEVLALLMKRMSNKEIADALFISQGTVKHHTHVIFEKLDVHSRREAVMKALDLNLLGYQ
jgi:LuxR family maltose regulon positive regulatory protein